MVQSDTTNHKKTANGIKPIYGEESHERKSRHKNLKSQANFSLLMMKPATITDNGETQVVSIIFERIRASKVVSAGNTMMHGILTHASEDVINRLLFEQINFTKNLRYYTHM